VLETLGPRLDAASEPARRRVTLAGVMLVLRRAALVAASCVVGAGLLAGCSGDSDETPQTVAASTAAPAVATTEPSASPTTVAVSGDSAVAEPSAEDSGSTDEAGGDGAEQPADPQPDDSGDDQAQADDGESDSADQ